MLPAFAQNRPMNPYLTEQPSRAEIDALGGATLVEFGTNWCGICNAAQPAIAEALAAAPATLRHLKVEDGSGRPLGRSFGIKLWPTLIFMRDGQELSRLVRPPGAEPIRQLLRQLNA
jgi:thioredoxin 1